MNNKDLQELKKAEKRHLVVMFSILLFALLNFCLGFMIGKKLNKMENKEVFITNTIQLWTSADVVHIEAVGYTPNESIYIEWDANSLVRDLPSLYTLCKQAIEQGEGSLKEKLKDFVDEIKKDLE